MSTEAAAAIETALAKHGGPNPSDGNGSRDDAPPSSGAGPEPAGDSGSESSAQPPSSTDAAARTAERASDQPGEPTDDWTTPEKRSRMLRNAQKRERAEHAAELERRLGFKLDDENAVANVRAFLSNPRQYLEQHAQHYGFAPATAQPPAAPPPAPKFEKPVPKLMSTDGLPAYDAAAVDAYVAHLQDNLATTLQRIDSLEQQVKPLGEMQKTFVTERIEGRARSYARDMMSEVKTWEGFDEMQSDILALMRRYDDVSVEQAYGYLLRTKYLPAQEKRLYQKWLADRDKLPPAPKGPGPAGASRGPTATSKGARNAREAIKIAMEKHSASA